MKLSLLVNWGSLAYQQSLEKENNYVTSYKWIPLRPPREVCESHLHQAY